MCGVICAIGLVEAGAQQTRDAAPNEVGTGAIAGVVLATTGSAQPVPARRAIVTLAGERLPVGRSAVTDDLGRFVIDRLPAGRFTLTATKPAYLAASYGAARPGRTGVPLVLTEGASITNVSLTLTHGAAIAGAVHDATGVAVPGAKVSATRILPDGSLGGVTSVTTDDRGSYRVFGITAGDYVVSATFPASTPGASADMAELTVTEIDRKLEALRMRRAAVPVTAAAPPPAAIATSRFVPVFHPRAFSAADAVRVAVGFGDERTGTDIVLDRVRSTIVDGTVTAAPVDGPMTIAMTYAGPSVDAAPGSAALLDRGGATRAFQVTGVVPGRYVLTARTAPGVRPMLWARAEIETSGNDLHGVALAMQPGLRLTGRLVFDGTSKPLADLSAVQVILDDDAPRPSGPAGAGRGMAPRAVSTTNAQGNFDVDDVVPGVYRVRTSLVSDPNGWWLRSAMVNGQDALDVPLRVDANTPLTNAVLRFSDRHTALSGRIEAPAGAAPGAYFLVVFPEDRAMWLPRARRIQSARAGTDGSYVFRDLPPGAYRLAALTDVTPDDLMDVTFLQALLPASIRVELADGEQKIQTLRVGG